MASHSGERINRAGQDLERSNSFGHELNPLESLREHSMFPKKSKELSQVSQIIDLELEK